MVVAVMVFDILSILKLADRVQYNRSPLTNSAFSGRISHSFSHVPPSFGPVEENFSLTVALVPNAVTFFDCVPQE
jgi:hypothetical protein